MEIFERWIVNMTQFVSFSIMFLSKEMAAIVCFFVIYSFFGWVLENSYSFFRGREFFKPNFILGPFKPMYGFAPILLVYLIPHNSHWGLLLLLCFFIPTAVEYVTGVWLERTFGQKWWDYSNHKFQVQGHICLSYSLCWIFLSFICIKFIHPNVEMVYKSFASMWLFIWPAVVIYFGIELYFAWKRHIPQEQAIRTQG